jgi:MFS superfamily sulfate permease-like transporter
MLAGIIIGVILSIVDMLRRVSQPHIAVLGKMPGMDQYLDMRLHPEAVPVPGALLVRVDASIIFANAKAVKKFIIGQLDKASTPVRLVVVDLRSTPLLDITGVDMIDELGEQLQERGIRLRLANMSGQVRDVLARAGYERRYGRTPENRTISAIMDETG